LLTFCVCLLEKFKGKPDAGALGKANAANLHVRFDEGEGNSLPSLREKESLCSLSKWTMRISAFRAVFAEPPVSQKG